MTIYEQTAIERRYRGDTYREIASLLRKMGMQFSEGTLRNWFMVDGRLYLDYLTYEAKENNWTQEHSHQEAIKMSAHTMKIRKQILKAAIKNGDWRLALDTAKDIDDRAGNVVVRKAEVNLDDKRTDPITDYEQFKAELTRQGINPRTGLRVATPKVESN